MRISEQPHIVHVYTYEPQKVQILAPLKCGTRYLTGTDFTSKEFCHTYELINILNPDYTIYFVTRDPLEHLYSALFTEILVVDRKYGADAWSQVLTNQIHHWSPTLYKTLFENWKLRKTLLWSFNFIDLTELSDVMHQYNLDKPYNENEFNFQNENDNPSGLNRKDVCEKLKAINPKNYFEMERDAMIERYFLYKLKNKIRK